MLILPFQHFIDNDTKRLGFFHTFYFGIVEFERRGVINLIYSSLMTNNHKFSFFGFVLSLFTLNRSLIFNSSSFVMRTSSFMSLDAIVVCVSSAYMFILEESTQPPKSLRYTMKRRGPKQDP